MELAEVRPEDKELLRNVNQKYLYEMTNYYDDEMDETGNYHYGYFDAYFTDPERKAYFIYDGGKLCGFAMLNPYSNIGERPDHTLAEFTVFPAFRKRHIATEAIEELFRRFKGNWEIKYNEKNGAAKKFWNNVTAPYAPGKIKLNDYETVLIFRVE